MNAEECRKLLMQEGCNPHIYSVGSSGSADDAFCLEKVGNKWVVFYTERGKHSNPIYSSESESEASQYFYEYIMSMQHNHCVGFFVEEINSFNFQAELKKHKIVSTSDAIPYGGINDQRYRVFVSGKAIFKVKELFKFLPIKD
jgi:hypothetical protein